MQHPHDRYYAQDHQYPLENPRNLPRGAIYRYLLGQGPLPAPRCVCACSSQCSWRVQRRHQSTSSRAGGTQPAPQGGAPMPAPGGHYGPVEAKQVAVLAPINTTKDSQPVIQASFKLAANLPPEEVLGAYQIDPSLFYVLKPPSC
ncbi:hypothetical protein C8Q73DRAFT_205900 [Cubamyces lactineus]|nr:hypothetical protein C8Q73DRAFT_205900 [Cubamyces lactineus]